MRAALAFAVLLGTSTACDAPRIDVAAVDAGPDPSAAADGPPGDGPARDGPSADLARPATVDLALPPPPPDLARPVDLARPPPDLNRQPVCPPSGPRDCSPGPGTGEGDQCFDATSCFYPAVRDAVNGTVRDNPSWFDTSSGNPLVLDEASYMGEVLRRLGAAGLCAIRDPNAGDEIVVKHDNRWSENFDILTATNYVRSGAGIFTATCAPAWF